MMYFYSKYEYVFLWIFNFIWIAADNTKFEDDPPCPAELFRIINLGRSSLLISWDSKEIHTYMSSKNETLDEYLMEWTTYFNEDVEVDGTCYSYEKNLKISSLREITNYKFEIFISNDYSSQTCWIKRKTIFNSNQSIPTKPYFEFGGLGKKRSDALEILQPVKEIVWFPCGRKGYCEKEEVAGSYFSVKYKMLDSRQEWRTYEYNDGYKVLYGLLPGRPYEIIVTSISSAGNVDLKTDSDPQEVLIKPVCSSVRSVQIITLTNSSVFIFWKKPKGCLPSMSRLGYVVFGRVFDSSPVVLLNYSNDEIPYEVEITNDFYSYEFNHRGTKILKLDPGVSYTFYIVPRSGKGLYGTEYRIDYTPHIYPVNLTLARPEFLHGFFRRCMLTIQWLPCGITHDCKDTMPGSYFVIKYRNETDQSDMEEIEKLDDFTTIDLFPKTKYIISVESRDEFNNSKSSVEQHISTDDCDR